MAALDSAEGAGRTAWFRRDTPLRRFLRTETGSGAVLLAAAVAALIWVNIDASSYGRVWHTQLSVHLGHSVVSLDLRGWINSGLMSFFFLVVGLEARREFDMGEFRERPRIVLPVLAGVGGMIGAVGLYLAVNAGRPRRTAGRWRCRPIRLSRSASSHCSAGASRTGCADSS
jgi:Na+/H+ antiporter NhaA